MNYRKKRNGVLLMGENRGCRKLEQRVGDKKAMTNTGYEKDVKHKLEHREEWKRRLCTSDCS